LGRKTYRNDNFKKTLYTIDFIITIPLGCSDDDDGKINLLIGTWIGVTSKADSFENGTLVNSETVDVSSFTLSLNADGTFTFSNSAIPSENNSGTWSQPTANQIQTIDGFFAIKPNRPCPPSADGFVSVVDILTLNETTLIVEDSEESTSSGITFRDVFTTTFRRQ